MAGKNEFSFVTVKCSMGLLIKSLCVHEMIFIPLQTWDLLHLMFQGFIGLCEHFLAEHPGYFITPVRINAIESYFSQLKYAARGQLSAINYETAQAAVETSKAASTKQPHEADYRDAHVDIHPAQLTKK